MKDLVAKALNAAPTDGRVKLSLKVKVTKKAGKLSSIGKKDEK